MPKSNITIVIPAFNAAKYIVETLDSIRKQTVQPFEVIVIDDCSEDDTVAVVEKYACDNTYPISIVKSVANHGIGVSRQHGADLAKTDYVAYLSSDDCYQPNFIELCYPYLKGNVATYTAYERCDEHLNQISIFSPPEFSVGSVLDWALKKNMYVNFSSIIVPKCLFSEVKFEGTLRHGEDLIFLLDSVLAKQKWQLVNVPLVLYRVHSAAGTFTQRPEEFELLWRYLFKRLQKFGIPDKTIHRAYMASKRKAFPWYPRWVAKSYKAFKRLLCHR